MRSWGERLVIFFFFQAEDGIRDIGVTGVQTCALPISTASAIRSESAARTSLSALDQAAGTSRNPARAIARRAVVRASAGAFGSRATSAKIGRASCRERV